MQYIRNLTVCRYKIKNDSKSEKESPLLIYLIQCCQGNFSAELIFLQTSAVNYLIMYLS